MVSELRTVVPLRKRYVDLFFFVYFAFHLIASICVDSTSYFL